MSIFGSVPEVTPTKSEQLTANRLVEDHIRLYSYVQHPDKLKDAIAQTIATMVYRANPNR